MNIEDELYALLTGTPAIAALIGTRLFPIEAEQNKTLPYIVYEIVSSVPVEPSSVQVNSPPQDGETNETVIDIASYGATYTAARALAQLVRSAMIAGLDAAVIENTQASRDSDTRRKFVAQSYRIWHPEEFP